MTDEKKPPQEVAVVQRRAMEPLEYMERESTRTLSLLMSEYAASHERVYKLLTLLVGGAGAVGSYVLSRMAVASPPAEWVPLAVLALWWFAIAAWLMWRGVQSHRLGVGATPNVLGSSYSAKGGDFGVDVTSENQLALTNTRLAELATQQVRIQDYGDACAARAKAMDAAYWAAAASPLPPLLALAAVWLVGRFI